MRHLIAILLISLAVAGLAQNNPEVSIVTSKNRVIDSLETKLKTVNQEERFEVVYSLFRECLPVDQNRSWIHIKDAFKQALIMRDSLKIVRAYNGMAFILKNRGELKQAIDMYGIALRIAQRNDQQDQQKYLLNNLALCYSSAGAYDKALYYNYESLKLREQEGDSVDISVALNNIGLNYQQLNDQEHALLYYKKCYDIRVNNKISEDLERFLVNIALTYNKLKNFKEAENNLIEASENCRKRECKKDVTIEISNAFGEVLINQNKFEEAQKYFEESLRLIKDNSNSIYSLGTSEIEYYSFTLYWLGFVHYSQDNFETALDYLSESLKMSEKSFIQDNMRDNYILISKILASKKDFKKAFEYQSQYIQLNSEMLSGNVIRKITELRTNFDQRENLSKIAAQERIVSLQNEFNIAIGAIAILAFLISLTLLRMYIQKQGVARLLDVKVGERTRELERNRNELMHAHDEKIVVLRTISSCLTSSLATLKGLSIIAAHDLPQHHLIYFREAESTTEQMVTYIRPFTKDLNDQNGNTLGQNI